MRRWIKVGCMSCEESEFLFKQWDREEETDLWVCPSCGMFYYPREVLPSPEIVRREKEVREDG
jgi:hypothetical protein